MRKPKELKQPWGQLRKPSSSSIPETSGTKQEAGRVYSLGFSDQARNYYKVVFIFSPSYHARLGRKIRQAHWEELCEIVESKFLWLTGEKEKGE